MRSLSKFLYQLILLSLLSFVPKDPIFLLRQRDALLHRCCSCTTMDADARSISIRINVHSSNPHPHEEINLATFVCSCSDNSILIVTVEGQQGQIEAAPAIVGEKSRLRWTGIMLFRSLWALAAHLLGLERTSAFSCVDLPLFISQGRQGVCQRRRTYYLAISTHVVASLRLLLLLFFIILLYCPALASSRPITLPFYYCQCFRRHHAARMHYIV